MKSPLTPVHSQAFESALCGPLVAYPREKCVHELFEDQVLCTPEAIALDWEGQELRYWELDARANRLAEHLRGLGVGPDSRVAICVGRSVESVAGVLGILKAGGAYVPLDPRYPADRLAFMLEDSKATVLLTQSGVEGIAKLRCDHTILLDDFPWTPEDGASHSGERSGAPAPESLAYVIYTSGSTGKPKGVAMGHRALVNLISWQIRQSSGLPAGARTIQFTSLSFDVSFQEIFSTLCSGGTLVLMPEELRYDATLLLRFLREGRIHRLFLPFVALQHLADAAVNEASAAPADLLEVITAGEQLQITPAIEAFFRRIPGAVLHNHYGPSETHVATAYALPRNTETWAKLPPIGRPIANVRIELLDPEGRMVPPGEAGEVFIGGDCLARGYLDRPEATAERFLTLPAENGQCERYYRTGDQARVNAAGELEYLGRLDDQIKIRGYRVEPGEIEAALSRHPSVRECAVAAQGEGNSRQLAAYVVAARGMPATAEDLRAFLEERLADYLVPIHYVILEALPLTPSGKINRRALPVPPSLLDGSVSSRFVSPANPLEELIAGIWGEVLGRSRVGTRDHFLELGGTSLLVARIQGQLETKLGRPVPITVLLQCPTIEQLAARLADKDGGGGSSGRDAIAERASRQREMMARRQAARRQRGG